MVDRMFDSRGIPQAHSVQVFTCGDPECGHPHVVAFDEHGKPVLVMILGDVSCAAIVDLWLHGKILG